MQAISQKEFEGAIRKVANEGHAVKVISFLDTELKSNSIQTNTMN